MFEPVLRKLRLFGSITQEDEAILLRICAGHARSIPAGIDVLSEGENPQYVHLIASGFACRYKVLAEGRRQIVAYLVPGDFCDLHSFVMRSSDHSIGTMAPSEIVEIPKRDVEKILALPSLIRPMMMSTLVDEAILREWIANIGRRPARKRLANLFCEMHVRLQNVGLASDENFSFPLTQTDLGDTVGLSTVHVNRSIKDLRDKGLISFSKRAITIPSFRKLRDYCGFQQNYLTLGGIERNLESKTMLPAQ